MVYVRGWDLRRARRLMHMETEAVEKNRILTVDQSRRSPVGDDWDLLQTKLMFHKEMANRQ